MGISSGFLLLFFFVLGSVFGSFLNVLIDRLSTGRSFIKGRSYCEKCKKTLKVKDLIPLLSFAFLRGRCRYCKTKIPSSLFIVELTTGLSFVILALLVLKSSILLVPTLFMGAIVFSFIGIFFADVKYGIIPDFFVALSLFATLFYLYFSKLPIIDNFIVGFLTLVFFLFLFLITKGRGMGFGDVKLSFVLGFLIGFPNIIICLYLAFLTGAIISIILVLCKKVKFFGGTIPFGPFLIGAAFVTLFFGNQILSTFLQTFMQ